MPKHPVALDRGWSERFHSWLFFEATRRGIAPESAYGSKDGFPKLARGEKAELLRRMGFEAPQQFYRYLAPDGPIPSKRTLRNICDGLNIAWPSAALMAGLFDEFFAIAQALCAMGYTWCEDDNLKYLTAYGVEASSLKSSSIDSRRYVVLQRHDWDLNHAAGPFQRFCAVPKPIAVAITLVRAYFVPMWHSMRNGRVGYWQDVLRSAEPMIRAAQTTLTQSRGRKRIDPLLRRALDVLGDPVIRRRAHWIAPEYVGEWANSVSTPYTRFIENSLFNYPLLPSEGTDLDIRALPSAEELASS